MSVDSVVCSITGLVPNALWGPVSFVNTALSAPYPRSVSTPAHRQTTSLSLHLHFYAYPTGPLLTHLIR